MSDVPEDAIQAAAEAMCATHISGLHRDMDSPDPRMRIAACFDCQRKAAAAMPAIRVAIAQDAVALRKGMLGNSQFADGYRTACNDFAARLIGVGTP